MKRRNFLQSVVALLATPLIGASEHRDIGASEKKAGPELASAGQWTLPENVKPGMRVAHGCQAGFVDVRPGRTHFAKLLHRDAFRLERLMVASHATTHLRIWQQYPRGPFETMLKLKFAENSQPYPLNVPWNLGEDVTLLIAVTNLSPQTECCVVYLDGSVETKWVPLYDSFTVEASTPPPRLHA